MKKIFFITNDKIWFSKNYYTSNNDLLSIIKCFKAKYEINLIARKAKKKLDFILKEKLNFLEIKDIKDIKDNPLNIFMISITPYNFFCLIYLFLFKRKKLKGFVYLRSDGFLEYKIRYGILGYYIYKIMFNFVTKNLKIISCCKNFTNIKVKKIIHPSDIDQKWLLKKSFNKSYLFDFIYVGRFKKEKGSFYLINIFKNILTKYNLLFVGVKKKSLSKKFYNKNIKFRNPISNVDELINVYDSSKIFILPSFTEGFPKVVSESLARLKPVIIFEEINYIIEKRYGIFVCKRNSKNIIDTVNFIITNYKSIQSKIAKNFHYTHNNFKQELMKVVSNEY